MRKTLSAKRNILAASACVLASTLYISESDAVGLPMLAGHISTTDLLKDDKFLIQPVNHTPGHRRKKGDSDSGSSGSSFGGGSSRSGGSRDGSSGSSFSGGSDSGSSNRPRNTLDSGSGSDFGQSNSGSNFNRNSGSGQIGSSGSSGGFNSSNGGRGFGGTDSDSGSSFSGGRNPAVNSGQGGGFNQGGNQAGSSVGFGDGQQRPTLQRQDNVPKGLAAGYDPSSAPGGGVERNPYDTPASVPVPSNQRPNSSSDGLDAFNRQYPPPPPPGQSRVGSLNNQYDSTNAPLDGGSNPQNPYTDANLPQPNNPNTGGLDAFNQKYPPPPPPGQSRVGSLNNQYDGTNAPLDGGPQLQGDGYSLAGPPGDFYGDGPLPALPQTPTNQLPAGNNYATAGDQGNGINGGTLPPLPQTPANQLPAGSNYANVGDQGGNYPLAPVPNDLSGVTQGRNNQLPAGSGYATTAPQGGNVGGNYPLAP
ncbi:MAG: hypothetical protein ABJ349_04600, partial [Hyphomicrobiales bacterium]